MDLKTLLGVIRNTEEFLDSALESAETRMARAIRNLERKIVTLAAMLKVGPGGRIKGPHWNLSRAQKVHAQLVGAFEEVYGKAALVHIDRFDEALRLIKANFKRLRVEVGYSTADKKLIEALKAQTYQQFESLGQATQNRIAQEVYDSVVSGAPFGQLTLGISAALVGHEDVRGRPLVQYAGTYAHDSLMAFYSTIHQKKSKDAGMTHQLYYGSIIGSTRKFCAERAGKVFSNEEVDSWNKLDWDGKKPGNVWINRGGYRCRHHLQPVMPEWIEGGEIEVQRWG